MTMPDCVNLRALFGTDYRITFDPCYDPFNVPRDKLDPSMMQLPCKGGITIYLHGGDLLAVEVDYHGTLAKRLAALAGVRVHQDGGWGGEMTLLFAIALFDQVAAIVQPRRKRKLNLSPEQRQAAATRLALVNQRRRTRTQSEPGSPETPQKAQGGAPVDH
jgi:hypothetical protein